MNDKIEFYDSNGLVAAVESSMVPAVGQYISIREETWEVMNVTFALDCADEHSERQMRCNIDIEPR